MIELKQLIFSYENQQNIIQGIDLSVKEGEFVVLCGESGCGKSTLLRILNGLIPELYSGNLSAEGQVLDYPILTKDFISYVKEIGVVFQNPKTQFFTSDVYSELAFAMENYGVSREKMIKRLNEITEKLSLTPFIDRSMFHLSGGQKQLIAFASASMLPHRLFLLDEPSSNLDEKTISELKQYLSLLKQQGMTIIVSEHRLYYLKDLADRYIQMDQGKIIGDYTREEMTSFSINKLKKMGLRSLTPTRLEKREVLHKRISDSRLRFEEVTFNYRKSSVPVQLSELVLENNVTIGIVGHNGAGKSTFSKLVSGLLKPKTGRILLNEQPITSKELIKASFVVMQDVNLQLFFETVEKEIMLNAKNKDAYQQIVKMLQLEPLLDRHPQTLSGGEKQRVAIASALLSGKKIIVFDEPTSGLDLKHMEEVSQTIQWLQEQNVLVLVITHDKEFLNQTCQRILHFEQGQVKEDYFIVNNKESI